MSLILQLIITDRLVSRLALFCLTTCSGTETYAGCRNEARAHPDPIQQTVERQLWSRQAELAQCTVWDVSLGVKVFKLVILTCQLLPLLCDCLRCSQILAWVRQESYCKEACYVGNFSLVKSLCCLQGSSLLILSCRQRRKQLSDGL